MKCLSKRWPAALGVLLTGSVMLAQSPAAGPSTQSPAAPQPPATQRPTSEPDIPQTPTFRVSVNLVTTDVIVRDSLGQFVADVNKDEFEVFEDGVPQTVSSLVMVHGGRTYNLQLPPPAAPPEGIILPPARPANDTAGRIFVVFIDDLHLDFPNTSRVRELVKKIRDTLIHQGDMFGIVSSGTSSISIDLTYDIKRFDEAIKKIIGGGLKPTDIIQGPSGAEGPSEIMYRAHVAFSTVYDLMKQLELVHNRRKALLYISNGYDFNPFPKSRSGELQGDYFEKRLGSAGTQTNADGTPLSAEQEPNAALGAHFGEADLAQELTDVTRAANRANATIYSIDPRGLVGGPDLDDNVDPTEWNAYVSNSINSLRVLAEQTGGLAVVNQNDFSRALKRIDAETSDYYMLGYYSSNPDPLRRLRTIDVKVKRKDLDVWSRKSYSLKPAPRPVVDKKK